MHITPTIFFQGNCREAMAFYQGLMGGTLTLKTYGELGDEAPEGWDDKIAYAELKSDGFCIKGLDSKIANAEARKVELEISGDDEEKLRGIFNALCEGGKAKSLLEEQPWGGLSGRLFDKYGLDWMIVVHGK
jgi:PhnB protein